MGEWTNWVLCKVTKVGGLTVTMLPVGENNGTEFTFTIPGGEPPKVGDEFRFTPLQQNAEEQP